MILIPRRFNVAGAGESVYPSITYPYRQPSNRFSRRTPTGNELWDAIVKRLSTQKGAHRVYDDTYGFDWYAVVGHDEYWCRNNLPTLISDCLAADDRVYGVQIKQMMFDGDTVIIRLVINGSLMGDFVGNIGG